MRAWGPSVVSFGRTHSSHGHGPQSRSHGHGPQSRPRGRRLPARGAGDSRGLLDAGRPRHVCYLRTASEGRATRSHLLRPSRPRARPSSGPVPALPRGPPAPLPRRGPRERLSRAARGAGARWSVPGLSRSLRAPVAPRQPDGPRAGAAEKEGGQRAGGGGSKR